VVYDCVGGICWLDLATGTTVLDYRHGISEPTWDKSRDGLLLRGDYSSVVRYRQYDNSLITQPTGFYVERPRISPDGRDVLYECDYYRQYDALENLCHLDATGAVTLYKSVAYAASWSPRDGTLAYMRSFDWGWTRTLVIGPMETQPNPDGPGATEYPGFEDVTETSWSPDGTRLALVHGGGELWIYSMPGLTDPVRIAYVEGTRISSVSWR
jgi:Tol biopolymer transport system component